MKKLTPTERLRTLVETTNLDVAEIARRAGIDRQNLHKILKGKTANPGILTVQVIVAALGYTMDDYYQGPKKKLRRFRVFCAVKCTKCDWRSLRRILTSAKTAAQAKRLALAGIYRHENCNGQVKAIDFKGMELDNFAQ